MIILLDWSGSMQSVMKHVLQQAITLVMFCRRVNIPFQVLAFADGRYPSKWDGYISRDNKNYPKNVISAAGYGYFLMELFSHKMNNNDFKRMVEFALSRGLEAACPLNGTPLTESLLYMYSHIEKFTKSHNVEKLSFITLTDGQGSRFGYYPTSNTIDGKRVNKKYFIKTSTGTMIQFEDDTATQTIAVLRAIKERYKCNVVGFYIGATADLGEFIINTYGADWYYSQRSEVVKDKIRTDCKKEDLSVLNDVPGYDIFFFIQSSKLKVYSDDLQINSEDNVKKIAKEFTKHLVKKKKSRILLNEFVKIIA